jgi:amino acid adenylation domain-containing protein
MSRPLQASIVSFSEAITARFEEQASATPERIALCIGGATLTYRALNNEANRIARVLQATSPGAEPVGVVLGHGSSVVAVLLGVLKAGKIFVPLDSKQPPARQRRILDDCGLRLLVTDTEHLPQARAVLSPSLQVINLDTEAVPFTSGNLAFPIGGDALACLLYTSGSTGAPKAAMQPHRSLLGRAHLMKALLKVTGDDRVAMFSACTVSQGISTALVALLNGASLYPYDLRERGVGDLAGWLIDNKISVMTCGPSVFRHFVRTLGAHTEFPHLRVIRLGSEQTLPHDLELFHQHFSQQCVLVSVLGSTESGQVAAYVTRRGNEIPEVVPAGYPVDGATVRILDDDGHVCPVGQAGEIAVRSRYLFSGYWKDEARTAAAFVSVPGVGGGKFYRTGDLARMRPDGCLEYIGRTNLRVKIRGVRMELEEIERVLGANASVLEAVVSVETDRNGDQRLVAFVVPATDPAPTSADLRGYLRNTLPEQMVPAVFRFRPELPRTANGKISRMALAASAAEPRHVESDSQQPSDTVEGCLLHLWENLLEHRPISVTDDFFELGGHSLLAARLNASIEKAFGAKLPLSAFIQHSTIQGQARLIRHHRKESPWPSLVPLRTGGSKPPLFCMHMRDGQVLSYRDLARHLPSDQPLYGLQSKGLDKTSPINTRIEDMARDYVAEMRAFWPSGPYAICGWSFGGVIAFEVARQLEREGQTVALLALFDSVVPRSARRLDAVLRREAVRVPLHASALLKRSGRRSYLRGKFQTTKKLYEAALWRLVVRWYRRGGWLPGVLRDVERTNRVALREYLPGPLRGRITLYNVVRQRRRDSSVEWRTLAGGGWTPTTYQGRIST